MLGEGGEGVTYEQLIGQALDIVMHVRQDDYSGDSWMIVREKLRSGERRWGFLRFGWGSCSGCDALEGCENAYEQQALRDELVGQVVWRDTPEDLIAWYDTQRDHEGEYDRNRPEHLLLMLAFKLRHTMHLSECTLTIK